MGAVAAGEGGSPAVGSMLTVRVLGCSLAGAAFAGSEMLGGGDGAERGAGCVAIGRRRKTGEGARETAFSPHGLGLARRCAGKTSFNQPTRAMTASVDSFTCATRPSTCSVRHIQRHSLHQCMLRHLPTSKLPSYEAESRCPPLEHGSQYDARGHPSPVLLEGDTVSEYPESVLCASP